MIDNPFYEQPQADLWRGRTSDPQQYWYQRVECVKWHDYLLQAPAAQPTLGLLGYAVDEGVARNQGRIGAADGPNEIRTYLAGLADHLQPATAVIDLGNVQCPNHQLAQTQELLAAKIAVLKARNTFPVLLGGGHDIAFAHYRGIWQYLRQSAPANRLGIINLDAHLDLRPAIDGPTSGTPFFQLATDAQSRGEQLAYLCLGVQLAANTPALLANAKQFGSDFIEAKDFTSSQLPAVQERVATFLSSVDNVCLTVDLDGFASAYAPGVSAPSPLGFDPAIAFAVLRQIAQSGKLTSLDVAELNPRYDQDKVTARLASRVVDTVVMALGRF